MSNTRKVRLIRAVISLGTALYAIAYIVGAFAHWYASMDPTVRAAGALFISAATLMVWGGVCFLRDFVREQEKRRSNLA